MCKWAPVRLDDCLALARCVDPDALHDWWTGGRDMEGWGASEEIFAAASDGNITQLEDLVSRGVKVDAQVRD